MHVLFKSFISSFATKKHIYNENLFLPLSPSQQDLNLFDIGCIDDSPNFGLKEA